MSDRQLLSKTCRFCAEADLTPLFAIEGYTLRKCAGCRMAYIDPLPQWDRRRDKLDTWGKEDTQDESRLNDAFSPASMQDYEQKLLEIERLSGQKGKLMDIGCSTGAFLFQAKKMGWDVSGLEISADSANFAREKVECPIIQENLSDAAIPQGSFDCIAGYEIIEHLHNPSEFFQKANEFLRPGGILALSTPNLASISFSILKGKWWVVSCPDEHVTFFTPRTLENMLKTHGFKPLSIYTRNVDIANIVLSLKKKKEGADYYEARDLRDKLKASPLRAATLRSLKKMINALFRIPLSPFYHQGEQIIAYAVKE